MPGIVSREDHADHEFGSPSQYRLGTYTPEDRWPESSRALDGKGELTNPGVGNGRKCLESSRSDTVHQGYPATCGGVFGNGHTTQADREEGNHQSNESEDANYLIHNSFENSNKEGCRELDVDVYSQPGVLPVHRTISETSDLSIEESQAKVVTQGGVELAQRKLSFMELESQCQHRWQKAHRQLSEALTWKYVELETLNIVEFVEVFNHEVSGF